MSSLGAIRRARAKSSESSSWGIETLYHGRVTVQVTGYNFGTGVGDIVFLSIRGVECPTVKRESSNSISCTTGHPILTEDKGKVRFSQRLTHMDRRLGVHNGSNLVSFHGNVLYQVLTRLVLLYAVSDTQHKPNKSRLNIRKTVLYPSTHLIAGGPLKRRN